LNTEAEAGRSRDQNFGLDALISLMAGRVKLPQNDHLIDTIDKVTISQNVPHCASY